MFCVNWVKKDCKAESLVKCRWEWDKDSALLSCRIQAMPRMRGEIIPSHPAHFQRELGSFPFRWHLAGHVHLPAIKEVAGQVIG